MKWVNCSELIFSVLRLLGLHTRSNVFLALKGHVTSHKAVPLRIVLHLLKSNLACLLNLQGHLNRPILVALSLAKVPLVPKRVPERTTFYVTCPFRLMGPKGPTRWNSL